MNIEYTNCTSTVELDLLPNECLGSDTKQFDGEVPVMLGIWRMQSTPSLPLLRMVVPDWALSMG